MERTPSESDAIGTTFTLSGMQTFEPNKKVSLFVNQRLKIISPLYTILKIR